MEKRAHHLIQYKCSHGETVQNIQLLMGEPVNGIDALQHKIVISGAL